MAASTEVRPADSALLTRDAYESLAPYYDALTADYDHERWLSELEMVARRHGLCGRRLLDVGCGTGKSFVPMLRRGYDVVACDLSPGMVARARERHPRPEQVFVSDARSLPDLGPVDLVTFLDDGINYLLEERDVDASLAGFARVMSPDGLLIFDANTLATYRTAFASEWVVNEPGARIRWCGASTPSFAAGDIGSATVEVLPHAEPIPARTIRSEHVQRHHPRELIERCCSRAGLVCVAAFGQLPGVRLSADVDEDLHTKVVYVVKKVACEATGGR